jgi:hypothetical protein
VDALVVVVPDREMELEDGREENRRVAVGWKAERE